MAKYLGPAGYECWDWDALLTSRIPQLPFMRNVSGRELNYPHGTPRLFLGMDEMPMFSFRDTIAWAAGGNMDLPSLAAYQSAGGVLMNNLWSKVEIEKVARQWLAPSKVRELMPAIHECVPVKLQRLSLKPRALDKELRVVFAGRMTGTRNFKEVAELFRKQFSYPLGKNGVEVKFIISTNSLSSGSTKHGDISFVEVQHNDRAKFHAMLAEAHVVVNLSTVEDFSLSTYEPLQLGVPVITLDKPWTGFLGADYPFRMEGFTQAYAMITAFATDYAGAVSALRGVGEDDLARLRLRAEEPHDVRGGRQPAAGPQAVPLRPAEGLGGRRGLQGDRRRVRQARGRHGRRAQGRPRDGALRGQGRQLRHPGRQAAEPVPAQAAHEPGRLARHQ